MEAELHSGDEIIRATAEARKERSIELDNCCEVKPQVLIHKGYRVQCPICGKRTKEYKVAYKAMEAWNKGERNAEKNELWNVGR